MAKRLTKKQQAQRHATAARKCVFPKHLRCETAEEWRQLKRTEWREVLSALRRFSYGSAYVPGGDTFYRIGKDVESMTEMMDAEGWVAW